MASFKTPLLIFGAVLVVLLSSFVEGSYANKRNSRQAQSLANVHFKVITTLDNELVQKSAKGGYEGFLVDVLNEACNRSGYPKQEVIPSPTDQFGTEMAPGVWSGMMGILQKGEADLVLGACQTLSAEAKVVTFSQPFHSEGFRVLYKVPPESESYSKMETLGKPFTPGMWSLLIFMCVLVSVCIFLIGRYSPYEDASTMGHKAMQNGITFANSFRYTFGVLVGQGGTTTPKSTSGRLLSFIWWIFALFVVVAYIAGLTVILFRVEPTGHTLPFTTLNQMSKQKKVGILVERHGPIMNYLTHSVGRIEARILGFINENRDDFLMDSIGEATKKLDANPGKYVLLISGPEAGFLSHRVPCDRIIIAEPLGSMSYAFACNQRTQICESLNVGILSMIEDGTMTVLKRKWFRSSCHHGKSYLMEYLPLYETLGVETDMITPLSITMARFSIAYILLGVGIGVSMLILVAEIIYGRTHNKQSGATLVGARRGDYTSEDYHEDDLST